MKCNQYLLKHVAAGGLLLLAVIFISACGSGAAADVVETATATASATPTATVPTPSPTATATRRAATSTVTPTQTASATSTPTSTPTRVLPSPTTMPSATPTPTRRSTPNASTSAGAVEVYKTMITLPTYPFKDYLVEQIDPLYNMPVYYFNRAEYEAAAPTPSPVDYSGVVLENDYLRLTFLPDLGGRLYSAVIKATEQELFYHNPVVKPSRYGVLQPYEANWWLATGGLEWAYPTQEHGYRFGVAWDYAVTQDADGATITLSDTAPNRTGLEVSVTLPANSATFTVAPMLTNNGPITAPVQLWTNAALSLTDGDSMSPNTQFIVPTDVITVHSRGEAGWTVPGELEKATWPQVGRTDLRQYRQWANYLGFFVPDQDVPFVGAYNPQTDLGIVRLAPPEATGSSGKLFAFGRDFPDRSYTDDNSQYFEIWGGANQGFWPEFDIPVPVGQTLGWQERWWPLAGLGGLTWATNDIAIFLTQANDDYILTALTAHPVQGQMLVTAEGQTVFSRSFSAEPSQPIQWQFEAAAQPILIEFTDSNGKTLLGYQTD